MATSLDRFEDIRSRFLAEERAYRKPVRASDLPHRYEDIGPEWLTAVLCARHPDAHVVACRLGPPDDGTSSRRRIEAEYDGAGVRGCRRASSARGRCGSPTATCSG